MFLFVIECQDSQPRSSLRQSTTPTNGDMLQHVPGTSTPTTTTSAVINKEKQVLPVNMAVNPMCGESSLSKAEIEVHIKSHFSVDNIPFIDEEDTEKNTEKVSIGMVYP